MAMDAGQAFVTIMPDVSKFGRELNKKVGDAASTAGDTGGEKGGSSFAGSFAKMVGGLGLGIGIGQMVGIGMRTAMDNEMAQVKFTQLLGSADKAKAYIGDLQQFAKRTPFDFPGLQDAASRFLAVGVAAGDVIPIMSSLGDITSMMGSGAQGIDRATTALTQMQQKGRVTGEEMMQLTEANIPAWQLLAESMGISVAQAQDLTSKGLVPADEMFKALRNTSGETLSKFAGGMDAASKTASGAWSTFKDTAATALSVPFTAGLGVMTGFLNFVSNSLIPGLAVAWDWLGRVAEQIGAWAVPIGVVAGIITAVFLPAMVMMGVQALISGAKVAASWALQKASAIGSMLAQGATITATGLLYVWLGIQAAASAVKQAAGWALGKAAAAVSWAAQLPLFVAQAAKWAWGGAQALAGAAMQVAAWVMQKAPMVVAIALAVATFAVMVAGWAISAIAAMAGAVVMAAAWLIALGPVGWVIAAILAVVAVFVVLWVKCEWFRDFWIALWDIIVNALKVAWEWIVSAVTAYVGFFIGIYVWLWNTIVGIWNALWDAVKAEFQAVWTWLTAAVGSVKSAFAAAWTWIKDTVTGVWNALWGFLTAAFTNWWNNLRASIETVKGAIVGAFRFVKDSLSSIWDGITSMVRRAVDTISGIAQGIWGGLKGAINAGIRMLNSAISGFNGLIGAVNSVPGVSVPTIPKIPQLADGGIVTRPTLAVVGEAGPEAVVPLDRWDSRGGAGGGPVQVRVFIGERELTDIVRVEVEDADGRTAAALAGGRRV